MAQHKNSVYKKISEEIALKIKSGQYAVGSLIEPERKLMEIYGVERTTIRRALQLLVSSGLIIKRAGLGTFVTDGKSIPVDENSLRPVAVDSPAVPAEAVSYIKRNGLPQGITIQPDLCSVASQIFEYLSANGHDNVIYIADSPSKFPFVCGEAVKRSMYQKETFVLSGRSKADDVFVSLWRSIRSPKPTAVIVDNDTAAALIIDTAGRMGVSVPDDISVISLIKNEGSEFAGCVCDNGLERNLIDAFGYLPEEKLCEMKLFLPVNFEEGSTAKPVIMDKIGTGSLSSFLL